MSATSPLPVMAGTLSLGAVIAGLAVLPSVRQSITKYLGFTAANSTWRILALLFAILNVKNLPFIWHWRVFRGILYQLYLQPQQQRPKHLFAPLITSSYNSLYDCDWNIHKSNSTYFVDLDVARAHFMGCILRTGLVRLNAGDEEGLPMEAVKASGRYEIALGGVGCHFQRQIEPLQRFEIYTRLLSWDRKWIYLVSHVIRKGAIKPDTYVLQPWKKTRRQAGSAIKEEDDLKKHIFATSIARYVVKKGRLTVNPEIVLERSRLLPPRPANVGLPPRAEASSDATPSTSVADTPATANGALTSPEQMAAAVSSKLGNVAAAAGKGQATDDDWTWEDMERERLRGLKMASHFDALSGLHDELRGGEVLGQYSDWW